VPQMRLFDDDPEEIARLADAVVRALRASPELVVGSVNHVPNKRGPGLRVYIEVLRTRPDHPTAERGDGADDFRVDVEVVNDPPRRPGRAVRGPRPALPRGSSSPRGAQRPDEGPEFVGVARSELLRTGLA
jgi:hypothetical protein